MIKILHVLPAVMLLSLSAEAQLPRDYQSKTASQKQEILFKQASQSPYSKKSILSKKGPSVLSMLKLFSTTYLAKSFTNPNDEFEKTKVKLIHTYGAVAKVKFNVTKNTKYTGILESGALGIIRFSLAKVGLPYSPGLAIKFLVDGEKSQNLFAMFSLEGQGSNYNFFANNFETEIADPTSSALKFLELIIVDHH